MSIVSVKNLVKRYKQGDTEIYAVRDASFDIQKGEFVAFTGQSGSGKTTLLNLIGCIDTPTSGYVEIDGIDVMSLNDKELARIRRQKIGYVFQDFNLIPILTAEENIIMPALLDSRKPDREYTLHLAEILGIEKRLQHLPSELSGGQRQRVAIARALINHPSIILADEPTGNLDKKSANEIMRVFDDIVQLGNTVMLVTHDEGYAEKCQRIMRIDDGNVISS